MKTEVWFGPVGSLESGPQVPWVSEAFLGQAWQWRTGGSEWERTAPSSHSEGSRRYDMRSGGRKYRFRFIVPSTELFRSGWGLGWRGRPTSKVIFEITLRLRLGYNGRSEVQRRSCLPPQLAEVCKIETLCWPPVNVTISLSAISSCLCPNLNTRASLDAQRWDAI